MALWKAAAWIVIVVVADHYLGGWTRRTINTALPAMVLGRYPQSTGWLYFIDLIFGLALVAYSEEVIFRRCARHMLRSCLGNDYTLAFVGSLLFGAYHWWAGLGIVAEAAIIGMLLMLFLQRSKALWPVFLAHYLADIIDFA